MWCVRSSAPATQESEKNTGLVWFLGGAASCKRKPENDTLGTKMFRTCDICISHLSLDGENGICFLGVKVLNQQTLEVIFYSLLHLSGLYTCSQNEEIAE